MQTMAVSNYSASILSGVAVLLSEAEVSATQSNASRAASSRKPAPFDYGPSASRNTQNSAKGAILLDDLIRVLGGFARCLLTR